MSKQERTPSGIRVAWGFLPEDWDAYQKGGVVFRHAWYKASKPGEPESWGTLCPEAARSGPIMLINRSNVAKCPECLRLMTPPAPTVLTSNVTAQAINTYYQVVLVWSTGTVDERKVIVTRPYSISEWDTTKEYPAFLYECTCGGRQQYNDRSASCDHIRAVIRKRGEEAAETIKES